MSLALKRTIKNAAPLPYEEVARAILGNQYELSLVLCGDKLARRMHKEYRLPSLLLRPRLRTDTVKLRQASKKTYSPNVLSFPYSKTDGEIFLNIRKTEREARALGISTRERLALLFVHGCYHLAGYDHSDKMEALEQKILRKFKLS